jgi:hypothetical protein
MDCATVEKRAAPEPWGTSNDTFGTTKVGDINITFVEYSDSKKILLKPDTVENL